MSRMKEKKEEAESNISSYMQMENSLLERMS